MTHEEKDKLLAEQAAEKEALLQKIAEMEAMKAEAEAKAAEAETKAAAAGEKEAEAVAALEAMRKAAEEQAQANAKTETAHKTETAPKTHPEKVEIELYKDENIKDDVQVFVNGRQYIIQRGIRVTVPWEVYVVLQNQQRMKKHIIAYNEKHEQK